MARSRSRSRSPKRSRRDEHDSRKRSKSPPRRDDRRRDERRARDVGVAPDGTKHDERDRRRSRSRSPGDRRREDATRSKREDDGGRRRSSRSPPPRNEQNRPSGSIMEPSEVQHVDFVKAEAGSAVSLKREASAPLNGLDSKGNTSGRQEPLSLEELLKRRKQQQAEDAKPKFLTKQEREALALARRQSEVAAQRGLPPPPPLPSATTPQAQSMRVDSRGDRDRDRGYRPSERERDRPREAGEERKKWQDEREREKELELIKQQYLGQVEKKKRIVRPSEKFKFNFDWDAGEDTSKDLNPLYANPHEATLLYGRGMRAGIDRREQKKQAAQFERDMLRKARAAAGIEESVETRRQEEQRERLANNYDGYDMRVEKHWTEKALDDMSERDWRIFREDFNISYKGSNTILPVRNWDEAKLPKELRKAVDKAGYKKPSPIQMAAIPIGLQQRDVIGIAETGSGKTAAFVIPMLCYIMRQPPMTEINSADGPYAVVLAPTRELAQQIEEETGKLAQYTSFKTVSIVGGQAIEEQGAKLRKGCEIVIATPYRLLDCLEQRYAVLNQCNYIVLDEADRMIDLGFEPQVLGVMEAMPSSNLRPENEAEDLNDKPVYRTTYMFSATMPPAVERLARKYLRRPIIVTIGNAGRATENVTQRVVMVKENEKAGRLEQELDVVDEKRAIVFVNTKRQCDNVYNQLESLGYRCTVLHGGRSQDQRETSIKGFREDTYNVLIATDVAGRGIDVPDVALVVNYDMPNTIEAYTHRIGRTGRAGKKGTALTLLTMSDTEVFYDLKKLLEESKAAVPPELARHESSKMKPGSLEAKAKRPDTVFAKK